MPCPAFRDSHRMIRRRGPKGGGHLQLANKAEHTGNQVPALDGHASRELASQSGLFEPAGVRATTSDIAALMVFSHQTYMTNLITRGMGSARRGSEAAPAVCGCAGRGRPCGRRHARRRERGRRLPAVHR